MEYIFGTSGDAETLKIKSNVQTNLIGYHQIEREYPDQKITDNFHIVRKLNSATDSEGYFYDWYEIDKRYRFTDKTMLLNEKIKNLQAENEQLKADNDLMKILLDIPVEEENANEERTESSEEVLS